MELKLLCKLLKLFFVVGPQGRGKDLGPSVFLAQRDTTTLTKSLESLLKDGSVTTQVDLALHMVLSRGALSTLKEGVWSVTIAPVPIKRRFLGGVSLSRVDMAGQCCWLDLAFLRFPVGRKFLQ